MARLLTARWMVRHAVKRAVLTSPYTGKLVTVVRGREVGCHVVLTTEDGREVVVDASQRLEQS